MSAASSAPRRFSKRARSSPSQSIRKDPPALLALRGAFETGSSAVGRTGTKSTSQSVQRVNPGRYSTWHCGQNMAGKFSTKETARVFSRMEPVFRDAMLTFLRALRHFRNQLQHFRIERKSFATLLRHSANRLRILPLESLFDRHVARFFENLQLTREIARCEFDRSPKRKIVELGYWIEEGQDQQPSRIMNDPVQL